MTLRSLSSASIATVVLCGLITASASAQNSSLLPAEESAVITVTGCLQSNGKERGKYVLTSPRLGAVANVEDGSCDAPIDAQALDLDDADDRGINPTLVGRWIEISGRLERETSTNPENLRELSVRSFRLVPVVPPQRAEVAAPLPLPQQAPEAPAPPPSPVATSGIEQPLPKTASPLAMIGLLGLLSSAVGVGFRVFGARSRR